MNYHHRVTSITGSNQLMSVNRRRDMTVDTVRHRSESVTINVLFMIKKAATHAFFSEKLPLCLVRRVTF